MLLYQSNKKSERQQMKQIMGYKKQQIQINVDHQFYCNIFLKMNKTIMLALLIVAVFSAHPMDKIRNAALDNSCATRTLEAIMPEIDAKLAELKQNQKSLELQVQVLVLMEKGKLMLEKCEVVKPELIVGDAIQAAGVGLLLASNCFKDVGIVLLLADTVIQDPTDWANDIIVAIFAYLIGQQGIKDCAQFIHFII